MNEKQGENDVRIMFVISNNKFKTLQSDIFINCLV